MTDIAKLEAKLKLIGASGEKGFYFTLKRAPGQHQVLRIELEDKEEVPIFVSYSHQELLCIAYLFKENEIKEAKIAEMNNEMLLTNISIPLSSFAKIKDQYVIYSSLSPQASLNDITQQLHTLSSNSIDALAEMKIFLK